MKKCLYVFFCLHISACLVTAQTDSNPTPSDNEGILRLPEGISLKVTSPDGTKMSIDPKNGSAILPVGKYKLKCWIYQKKDAEGISWKLHGHPGPIKEFEISKEPITLDINPEPINASLDVKCRGDYIFSQSLRSNAGEKLYIYRNGKRTDPPLLIITNQDKTFSVFMIGKYG